MDIKSAIQFILSIENLRSRQDLNNWCQNLGGRKKMYLYIQRLAPNHWERIQTPKDYVRFYYQTMLTDYKLYKGHNAGKSKTPKSLIESGKSERSKSKIAKDKAKRNDLIEKRRCRNQTYN
jgi:hypothetical protein